MRLALASFSLLFAVACSGTPTAPISGGTSTTSVVPSPNLVVSMPERDGATLLCGPGNWKPTLKSRTVGLEVATTTAGVQSCTSARGDSMTVGYRLSAVGLEFTEADSLMVQLLATTPSGSPVLWGMDNSAVLLVRSDSANAPVSTTAFGVNYPLYSRTASLPKTFFGGPVDTKKGKYYVDAVYTIKVRGCSNPSATGTSTFALDSLVITSVVSKQVAKGPPKTLSGKC